MIKPSRTSRQFRRLDRPLRSGHRERFDARFPSAGPVEMSPNAIVQNPGRSGGPIIVPVPIQGLVTKYEKMYDDPDPAKRKQWKDCSHYKRECDLLDCSPSHYAWVNESINAIGHWVSYKVPTITIAPMIPGYADVPIDAYPLLEAQPDGEFISPPPNLTQFLDAAIKAMTPGIKSELSILNSIIELKDFKTVGSTISNLGNFATSFFKRKPKVISRRTDGLLVKLRRTFSPAYGPTAAEATHTAADAYLQTKFNVLPLLDDVCGIQTALTTVRSQVNLLLANEGKILYRTFTDKMNPSYLSYEIPVSQVSFNQYPNSYSNGTGTTGACYGGSEEVMRLYRKVSNVEHVFRAKMKFTYTFDRWQREYAQFYGLMDSIGWNLNPSIVWNAIPWSFVVDWVVGVNRWLDKRKVLNLGPKVNILGFMWSCKRKRRVDSQLKSFQSLPPDAHPNLITLPAVTESAYQRKVIMPTLSSWVNTSGLNSNEISLGAALAITRRRPKKRV